MIWATRPKDMTPFKPFINKSVGAAKDLSDFMRAIADK
jgi:hypothetical protein